MVIPDDDGRDKCSTEDCRGLLIFEIITGVEKVYFILINQEVIIYSIIQFRRQQNKTKWSQR